ncbi:Protein Wfdc11 [Manis pentadactyla]|nr:Protein Wfdc11 [Manis pentadactyla]
MLANWEGGWDGHGQGRPKRWRKAVVRRGSFPGPKEIKNKAKKKVRKSSCQKALPWTRCRRPSWVGFNASSRGSHWRL